MVDGDETENLAGRSAYAEVEHRMRAYLLQHSLDSQRALAARRAVPHHPYRTALEAAYAEQRTAGE